MTSPQELNKIFKCIPKDVMNLIHQYQITPTAEVIKEYWKEHTIYMTELKNWIVWYRNECERLHCGMPLRLNVRDRESVKIFKNLYWYYNGIISLDANENAGWGRFTIYEKDKTIQDMIDWCQEGQHYGWPAIAAVVTINSKAMMCEPINRRFKELIIKPCSPTRKDTATRCYNHRTIITTITDCEIALIPRSTRSWSPPIGDRDIAVKWVKRIDDETSWRQRHYFGSVFSAAPCYAPRATFCTACAPVGHSTPSFISLQDHFKEFGFPTGHSELGKSLKKYIKFMCDYNGIKYNSNLSLKKLWNKVWRLL